MFLKARSSPSPFSKTLRRPEGSRWQWTTPRSQKSTGAMNRLIAEKKNPQADVYWANEPIRAEALRQKGISAPYFSPNAKGIPAVFKDSEGYWTGFSARVRVFIVNKGVREMPESILDYTNPKWKDRSVIANPLFGTTTSEVAALFTLWGNQKAKGFMSTLKCNRKMAHQGSVDEVRVHL
jgi:iron(III) transport system substrate-binding protein